MSEVNIEIGKQNYGETFKSGYFYKGQEIITGRKAGRPPTYIRNPKYYSQESKIDAATLYAVYGDTKQVSELANVPESIIRGWKQEPWWIEVQKQVYTEQNEKLAGRISQVLDTTITQLEERLEKGDQKINTKTGEIVSLKVEAGVLAKMFENLAHQRRITRGEPTSISAKIGIDDRLKGLEKAFLRFAQARDITNEETIPEEIQVTPEESSSPEEEEFIEVEVTDA